MMSKHGGSHPHGGWAATGCVVLLAGMLMGLSCSRNDKHFSDVRIAFFPGGGPDQSFAAIVYQGAKSAAEDLGCHMDYYWSYWDEDTIVSQFREAIYSEPDAICIVGHPGEERMRPLVEEAFRKNILVTFLNADLPDIKNDFMVHGCGYVGQDTYQSGYTLSSALARKYTPEQLREVHVLTWDYQTNAPLSHRARRSLGLLEALKEHHIPCHHSEIPLEMRGSCSSDELAVVLRPLLKSHPDTGAVIAD
ncbi:MAG: substrate-binding domain-containing protein, partial [Kiritimatiellae bacterium]|nr:substrate-binding domain-containing protein [Kiritimatiellia bacterium]